MRVLYLHCTSSAVRQQLHKLSERPLGAAHTEERECAVSAGIVRRLSHLPPEVGRGIDKHSDNISAQNDSSICLLNSFLREKWQAHGPAAREILPFPSRLRAGCTLLYHDPRSGRHYSVSRNTYDYCSCRLSDDTGLSLLTPIPDPPQKSLPPPRAIPDNQT